MTEEERRRKLAELEARRRSGLQTYQQLTNVKRDVRAITAPAQGLVKHQVDKALTGKIPDELYVMPLPGMPRPLPADILERQAEVAQRTGAWARPTGGELSRDIEGALKRGGVEIVAGDQRQVVTRGDDATAMAGRTEWPSISQHVKEWATGEGGQASKIGILGNVLEAPSRGAATAANYLLAPPDDSREWKHALGDIVGAVAGTSGDSGTVGEGGQVARRGAGWGDGLRKKLVDVRSGKLVMKDKAGVPIPPEKLTRRDLWGPLAPALETWMRQAWIPTKRGVAQVGDYAKTGMESALGVAPDFAEKTARPDGRAEADRWVKENLDAPLSTMDVNDPIFDEVGTALSIPLDPLNFVGAGPIRGAMKVAEKLPVVGKAAKVAGDIAGFDVAQLGTKKYWTGRRLAEHEGKAAGIGMAEQLEGVKRAAAATPAIETGEQVELIRRAADAAKSQDAPLIRQLLEGPAEVRLQDRPMQSVMDDIIQRADVSAGGGLTTEDAGLIVKAKQGDFYPLYNRRYHLAEKFGVPVTAPHPWAQGTRQQRRALASAKLLRQQGGRELAIAQEFGMVKPHVQPAGHMPHAPRAELPVKMENAGWPKAIVGAVESFGAPFLRKPGYNPHAGRAMAAMNDVQALRSEAADLIQQGRIVDPLEKRMYQDFIDNPKAQDPANVAHIRNAIVKRGVDVPAPSGTVEEANRIAAERGKQFKSTNQAVAFIEDPIRAAMADRAAVATKEMHARMSRGVKGITDTAGHRIAQPLEDFLAKPRRGVLPNAITQDLQRFAKGADPKQLRAAMFNDEKMRASLEQGLGPQGLKFIGTGDELARYMPELVNHVMPLPVYRDLLDVLPKMEPGALGRLGNVLLKGMSAWVPILLNTPRFHIVNAMFGMFQVHLATRLSQVVNPRLWRLAGKVAGGAEKGGIIPGVVKMGGRKVRVADLVEEARRLGIFEGGRVADLEGVWRQGGALYQNQRLRKLMQGANPFNMRRGALGLTRDPVAKIIAGRGIGGALGMAGGAATAENVQRVFIYLAKRADGMLPQEAAEQVVKFMFDYTGANLSKMEKKIRKVIPFYQWLKQSSLMTFDQVLKQPGKYAAWNRVYNLLHLAGQDKNIDLRNTPQRILDSGAIASPFAEDTDKRRQYLKVFERPGTQLAWTEDMASQVHPLGKAIYELSENKYLFGGMPISRGDDTNLEPDPLYRMTLGAAFPKIHKKDLLPYLARQHGALGNVAEMLLAQQDPEQQITNPRINGVDEANRRLNRLISTMTGLTPMQVNEQDIDLSATGSLERQTKSAEAQQMELAKRRIKGRPFGFTDQETIP